LHFIYVFLACGELSSTLLDTLRHLSTSDIELTIRLCMAAQDGALRHHGEILKRLRERRTVQARNLPLLRLVLKASRHHDVNVQWLERSLRPDAVIDTAVLRFLEDTHRHLTA
jgi:hypothetical protein